MTSSNPLIPNQPLLYCSKQTVPTPPNKLMFTEKAGVIKLPKIPNLPSHCSCSVVVSLARVSDTMAIILALFSVHEGGCGLGTRLLYFVIYSYFQGLIVSIFSIGAIPGALVAGGGKPARVMSCFTGIIFFCLPLHKFQY